MRSIDTLIPHLFGGKAARGYAKLKVESVVGELGAGVNDPSKLTSYTLSVPREKVKFAEYRYVPDALVAIDIGSEEGAWGGNGDAGIAARFPSDDRS
jgi:hypothetical protein